VGAIIAGGGSETEIRAAIATLPRLEMWPGSPQPKTPGSWGQPECFLSTEVVSRWEQQIQEARRGGPPPVKGPVLFMDDFGKYTEGSDGRPGWQPFSDAPQGRPRPRWMTERGTMSVDVPGPGGSLGHATGVLLAGDPDWKAFTNWKKYSAQVRIHLVREAPEGGSLGLRFRLGGGNVPQAQSGYAVRMSSRLIEFGWLSQGSFRQTQSVPLPSKSEAWHTLRVDCLDYTYKVYLDGRLLMGAEDWYGPRQGRVALEVRDAQGAFDDFEVRQFE
jgi:hypothetical protein